MSFSFCFGCSSYKILTIDPLPWQLLNNYLQCVQPLKECKKMSIFLFVDLLLQKSEFNMQLFRVNCGPSIVMEVRRAVGGVYWQTNRPTLGLAFINKHRGLLWVCSLVVIIWSLWLEGITVFSCKSNTNMGAPYKAWEKVIEWVLVLKDIFCTMLQICCVVLWNANFNS